MESRYKMVKLLVDNLIQGQLIVQGKKYKQRLSLQFRITSQGMEFTFFSDSHLAPKFFKLVANSKKSWSPFSKTNKIFLYAVSVLDRPSKIKLGKRSLTCYKVDTRM